MLIAALVLTSPAAFAKKNGCKSLLADLKKGTLNGVKPTASQKQVKQKLPCFTGATGEGEAWLNCGGGIFYLNHDFYFYTGADYIELRKNYAGRLSIPLLGAGLKEVQKEFGEPIRTQDEDTEVYYFFKTSYGCLVACISGTQVSKLCMYAKPANEVKLCL